MSGGGCLFITILAAATAKTTTNFLKRVQILYENFLATILSQTSHPFLSLYIYLYIGHPLSL